jgi:hypothetical protein
MSFDFSLRLDLASRSPSAPAAAGPCDIATAHALAVDGQPGLRDRRLAARGLETWRRRFVRSAHERPRKSVQALPSGA